MILTLALAKLAELSLAGKAVAAGAALTVAAGTAGAAGALPVVANDRSERPAVEQEQPEQDTEAPVQEAAEDEPVGKGPVEGEESVEGEKPVEEDEVEDDGTSRPADAGRPDDAPALPTQADFGQRTAETARTNGGVDGQEVADERRQDAGRPAEPAQSAESRRPAEQPDAPAEQPDGPAQQGDGSAEERPEPAEQSESGRDTARENSGREVPARAETRGPASAGAADTSEEDTAGR